MQGSVRPLQQPPGLQPNPWTDWVAAQGEPLTTSCSTLACYFKLHCLHSYSESAGFHVALAQTEYVHDALVPVAYALVCDFVPANCECSASHHELYCQLAAIC